MNTLRKIPLLIALLAIGGLFALAQAPSGPAVKGDIAAASEAWDMIANGALLIDVRSAEEFAEGHLEGALNIPHTEIDRLAATIGADTARPVVVYCRSGNRSGQAQKALEQRGYTAVFNGTGYEALVATRP